MMPYPVPGAPIAPVTAPMIPMVAQQPMPMPQPVMYPQPMPWAQPMGGMMMGGAPPQGGGAGNYGAHPEPALGVGLTESETLQQQIEFAHANRLYEPQDFKPADEDKSRFYWLRELDGNWTQRSRLTIDSLSCRWYMTDNGFFYAVRLED